MREVVDKVVLHAELKSWFPLRVNQGRRLAKPGKSPFEVSHLLQDLRLRDERPSGHMEVPSFWFAVEIDPDDFVDQGDGLVEAPLVFPERRLEGEDHRLVAQDVAHALCPLVPPFVGYRLRHLRFPHVARDAVGRRETSEDIGAQLEQPLLLARLPDRKARRHLDCKRGEIDRQGGILETRLHALLGKELCKPPTQVLLPGLNEAKGFFEGERLESLPKASRCRPGSEESHVN
jgi:hypothetical protein